MFDWIDKVTTKDLLSVGVLGILAWGTYTRYFSAEAVIGIVAGVFAYWFASKKED